MAPHVGQIREGFMSRVSPEDVEGKVQVEREQLLMWLVS